jgi:hypothetical protein
MRNPAMGVMSSDWTKQESISSLRDHGQAFRDTWKKSPLPKKSGQIGNYASSLRPDCSDHCI